MYMAQVEVSNGQLFFPRQDANTLGLLVKGCCFGRGASSVGARDTLRSQFAFFPYSRTGRDTHMQLFVTSSIFCKFDFRP